MSAGSEALDALSLTDAAGGVRAVGRPTGCLDSPLMVHECAVAAVTACLVAAAELAHARTGRRPDVRLDVGHVEAAVRSEALLRDPHGQPVAGFAPLSRLWRCRDGWVRTHANYPWHRRALLAAFDVRADSDEDVRSALEAAMARLPARDVEDRVYASGGLAVAARTVDDWRATAAGRAVAGSPLVSLEPAGPGSGRPLAAAGRLPASGLRILDLTRVIAGPVATRMLAALGAEVLRIDAPARPELPLHAVDGVIGKASAALDLTTPDGRRTFDRLLADADVLVTGYRPGALDGYGLSAARLRERHPDLTVASLSAWGTTGPWGTRRGFDSLVQIATGIGWAAIGTGRAVPANGERTAADRRTTDRSAADRPAAVRPAAGRPDAVRPAATGPAAGRPAVEPDGAGRPGALPCQLLDHATGYLLAAGVLTALARRARTSRPADVGVGLARTAAWLVDQGTRDDRRPSTPTDRQQPDARYRVALGDGWTGIAPPGVLDGTPLAWPRLPPRYAAGAASWDAR